MVRKIITYPDPILKKTSVDVDVFDHSLHELLDDMYETMQSKNGVGLAAVQVGVLLNVLIINPADEDGTQNKDNLLEIINPKILDKSGEVVYQEGCLSVPEYYEDVARFEKIKFEFHDRFGVKHIHEYDDFRAIIVQHEMDHLIGRLFIEKITYMKRKKFEKDWKKNRKAD